MTATILVIEDEPTILEGICTVLELEGYTAHGAPNGRVRLEKVQADIPDLIVYDVVMLEADGFEVLRNVRGTDHLRRVPFVFVSALSAAEDVQRGLEAGADAYLKKPFSHNDLLTLIDSLLAASHDC